ncbi:MAG: nucleotidyltransferase family protein [Acidobacteriaceae bacterium]
MVGGVLLAAGMSTRFGGDKQLAVFQGKTLLRCAAETLAEAPIDSAVAVLGPRADRHRQERAGLPFALVVNDETATGMSGSLIAGLTYLQTQDGPAQLDAVLVMVCDQPYCTPAHLRALVHTWRDSGKAIAASRYAQVLGVPALFDRTVFAPLQALSGQRGAAHLIREREGEVAAVDFPAGVIDIDTQEDLQRLTHGSPP